MKNRLSKIKNRFIIVLKKGPVRTYMTFFEGCIVKFNQLFANWFFMLKERMNIFKDWKKRSSRQSPCHLISMIGIFTPINEMKLPSKSFGEPIKTRRFSIVALKLNFIGWIWSIFRDIFLNTQTAFSINKPCKVCKIFFCGNNSISYGFNFRFYRLMNKIRFFFKKTHLIYNIKTIFFRGSKFFENLKFLEFFNQIRFYTCKKIQKLSFKYISMNRFVFGVYMFTYNGTSKYSLKPLNIFNFSRIYDINTSISNSIFCIDNTNGKTAIPISITSCISKIGRFNHADR